MASAHQMLCWNFELSQAASPKLLNPDITRYSSVFAVDSADSVRPGPSMSYNTKEL